MQVLIVCLDVVGRDVTSIETVDRLQLSIVHEDIRLHSANSSKQAVVSLNSN